MRCVVEFLLTHCSVCYKGRIALHIQLCLELRGLGTVDLGLSRGYIGCRLRYLCVGNVYLSIRLVDKSLKGARVNLEKKVSRLDERSLLIVLRQQVSSDF